MADDPVRVEVFMREESDEFMFVEVYHDGLRHTYWLTPWRGLCRCVALIWRGISVVEVRW